MSWQKRQSVQDQKICVWVIGGTLLDLGLEPCVRKTISFSVRACLFAVSCIHHMVPVNLSLDCLLSLAHFEDSRQGRLGFVVERGSGRLQSCALGSRWTQSQLFCANEWTAPRRAWNQQSHFLSLSRTFFYFSYSDASLPLLRRVATKKPPICKTQNH